MKKRLLLLTDYRGYFYSSTRAWDECMKIDRICEFLSGAGYAVEVKQFADVDFREENLAGVPVLYQSSEDPSLLYQSYIEDVLLGLSLAGALLIPRFSLFRAHQNKVFAEFLRDQSASDAVRNLSARAYGTAEEFLSRLERHKQPAVFKPAAGAMSSGVQLAKTNNEKRKSARDVSRSGSWLDHLKDIVKKRIREPRHLKSNHRNKFVVQDFVMGLENDFKVLVYGEKYYVVKRRNRPGDFRASGSGLFEHAVQVPEGLLDTAREIFMSFDCPFISLDLGFDGKLYRLFEFQFLMFGNVSLEKSTVSFQRSGNSWKAVEEVPDLEREFSASVVRYLESRKDTNARSVSI